MINKKLKHDDEAFTEAMKPTYFEHESLRTKVKWIRDEKGNIVSPFQVKKDWSNK